MEIEAEEIAAATSKPRGERRIRARVAQSRVALSRGALSRVALSRVALSRVALSRVALSRVALSRVAHWRAMRSHVVRAGLVICAVLGSWVGCGGETSRDGEAPEGVPETGEAGTETPAGSDGAEGTSGLSTDPDAARDDSSAPAATTLHFVDVTRESGIAFTHHPDRTESRYLPETMGGGVAIVDVNRDGAPDVICVDSGRLGESERRPEERNRLFLNDGQGRFTDATEAWGLPSSGYGMGICAGDYDGDGWIDLYTTHFGGGDRLLRNTGSGFVDVTERAGLEVEPRWSTSGGFFDLENDGDLDLYVANYLQYDPASAMKCYLLDVHHYCSPHLFEGELDRLFRNDGDGTFTLVSAETGIEGYAGKGLGVILGDVDWDGDADVYVANDVTRNLLYLNQGGGDLEEVGLLSGVALSESGKAEAGMGVDLADYDGDDNLDIVCTNFQGETNSIYRQEEGTFFREVSDAVGIGEPSRAHLGFGVDFLDADNDGDEDLIIVNGHVDDNVNAQTPSIQFAQPNLVFENRDGEMVDVTKAAGDAFEDVQVSRALATGDLDGDGDLDFVVVNNGGTAQVARNESRTGGFVSLWLEGSSANRTAIGARVEARIGDRVLKRQVLGSSSYLSVCDVRVHLGLGDAERVDEVAILWPGGARQVVGPLEAGTFYRIVEGREPRAYVPGRETIPPES